MRSLGRRLTRLEAQRDAPPGRNFVCYTDEEPPQLGPHDRLIVLARKCATVEQWIEQTARMRAQLTLPRQTGGSGGE